MEFLKYINEGSEGKKDLKGMYAQLNKQYFGGSLPNIKVAWSGGLKLAVGKATVRYVGIHQKKNRYQQYMQEIPISNVEVDMSSLKIVVSKIFDLKVKDIKAVMLHEMAHIKLFYEKKFGGHHDTPEFNGLIQRLRNDSGLDVPFKESDFKISKNIKGKEGIVITIHMSDGRKGIATYTTKMIKEKWLIWAKNLQYVTGQSSKINRINFYKINHPIIVEYPAKRKTSGLSWTIIEEETVQEIERKGKQFGYTDKQGGSLSPHTIGIRDRDMLPIPLELDKRGEVINLSDALRSKHR